MVFVSLKYIWPCVHFCYWDGGRGGTLAYCFWFRYIDTFITLLSIGLSLSTGISLIFHDTENVCTGN